MSISGRLISFHNIIQLPFYAENKITIIITHKRILHFHFQLWGYEKKFQFSPSTKQKKLLQLLNFYASVPKLFFFFFFFFMLGLWCTGILHYKFSSFFSHVSELFLFWGMMIVYTFTAECSFQRHKNIRVRIVEM